MERRPHALIYVLVDPRDGEIRYIGWTTQTLAKRYKSHLAYKGQAHRSKWVQALLQQGLGPIIRLIQAVPVENGPAAEIYWIKFHRDLGCRLERSCYSSQVVGVGNRTGDRRLAVPLAVSRART